VRLLPWASQAVPVDGEPIALDWSDGTLWSSGQTPTDQDDLVVEPFACTGLSPRYLIVTGSAAVARSLAFVAAPTAGRGFPVSPGQCNNSVLLLADGAKLTIQGSLSLSDDWAFVALGTSAVLQVGGDVTVTAGVLQGFGLVSALTFTASGAASHVAPGRDVGGVCGSCMPGWAHTHDPDVTGTLTFNVSLVTVGESATIWIKHDPGNLAPSDKVVITGTLALNNAHIVQMPPSDAPPEPTIFFAALANGSIWDVDTDVPYPWIACACPPCNRAVEVCDSGTPVGILPPPVCKSESPGSILTGLGDCMATRSPAAPPGATTCATMSPQCAHGVCIEPATCMCPSDGRGFGFNGALCDVAYCAGGCGGAAQGTCTWTALDALPHCECSSAWQGESCQQPRCVPPCTANGTCVAAGGGQSVCNCASGWQGPTCATPLAVDICPDCGGRGSCSAATTFICNCTVGYLGSSCAIATCPGPSCNGNGVCRPAFPPVCDCAPQWTGPTCSTRQCVSSDCLNGAACMLSANQPVCSCTPGWGGSRCQLVSFSANATATTTPAADPSIVGLAVGVALGVAAAGVLVGLTVYFVHRHRVASETLTMNKELAQKGLVELQRQKATGNFD
jgi:hypothetical protein